MALKSFNELYKIDVTEHCDYREAKDDNGKKIKVPYLNWATCMKLLHDNGATTVYYTPLKDATGSYLFKSADVSNKDGRQTGCYFVSVEIHIDDDVFVMDMPLMNGSLVVYNDTLNQLRISNSHARAFVKGVAIHTGLGFSLWTDDKDTDPAPDDLSGHSLKAIQQRIEQNFTAKLKRGMSDDDIYSSLGLSRKQYAQIMGYFKTLETLETRLQSL